MKSTSNIAVSVFLAAVMLTACGSLKTTPVLTPAQNVEPAASTATFTPAVPSATSTALPVFPTFTATATPSPRPLLPTEVSLSIPGGIVYYYFVDLAQYAPPQGSVVIMADNLILAPTQIELVYGSDVAADLRSALEAVLKDKRNVWQGSNLQIDQVAYSAGHADVVLKGEYYAVAPVVLTAARAQILMTLFANAALQSAAVTVNGDTIANISISNSMDAKPADYVYTRAEIETFMAENAYVNP